MTERMNLLEKILQNQSEKIDRLVEGFAALAASNERVNRLIERQDEAEERLHELELFKARQQARRELWATIITRVIPALLAVGAAVLGGVKLYLLAAIE